MIIDLIVQVIAGILIGMYLQYRRDKKKLAKLSTDISDKRLSQTVNDKIISNLLPGKSITNMKYILGEPVIIKNEYNAINKDEAPLDDNGKSMLMKVYLYQFKNAKLKITTYDDITINTVTIKPEYNEKIVISGLLYTDITLNESFYNAELDSLRRISFVFISNVEYFCYSLIELASPFYRRYTFFFTDYDEYIKIIGSETTSFLPMPTNLNFNTSLINTVSNNDLFKIFVKGNKKHLSDLKIFKTSVYKIDAMNKYKDGSFDALIKHYTTINRNFSAILLKIDIALKALYDEIEKEMSLDENERTMSNKRLAMISDVDAQAKEFNKYRTTKQETTIFQYMKGFVLPLKSIFESYKVYDYRNLTDEAEYIYNELLTKQKSFVEHLKSERRDLDFVDESQKELLKRYEEYIVKDKDSK